MTAPAGRRNSYLTIYTQTATTGDGAGQVVETFTKKCNAWGAVSAYVPGQNATAVRGQREQWANYHMNVDAQFVITIPYVSGLSADDRITEIDRNGDTVTYNIAGEPLPSGGDLIIPVAQVV